MRGCFGWMLLLALVGGCGKKGPPLAPVVLVPDAVTGVRARRVGDEVFLTLRLPTQNVDRSMPPDIGRIEVYGYTGPSAPARTRFTSVATLVGTLQQAGEAGDLVTLRETLTAGELTGTPLAAATSVPDGVPAGPGVVRDRVARYYLVVPFSTRGRAGPPSAVVELPLVSPPLAPSGVQVRYTAEAAIVSWERVEDPLSAPADESAVAAVAPLEPVVGAPNAPGPVSGPARYNVYLTVAADPAPASVPMPLNPAPLDATTFTDPLALDGRPRCYEVTAVRSTGPTTVEGYRSRPACITPVDTFPPAPPSGLSAIALGGAISLIWEANLEPDLAGYVVLRGEAGDDTLTPVTSGLLTATRFTDGDVRPGVRYVYAVTAVDSRDPPNVSAESARVEETAR
jgi:hypothetical protein